MSLLHVAPLEAPLASIMSTRRGTALPKEPECVERVKDVRIYGQPETIAGGESLEEKVQSLTGRVEKLNHK